MSFLKSYFAPGRGDGSEKKGSEVKRTPSQVHEISLKKLTSGRAVASGVSNEPVTGLVPGGVTPRNPYESHPSSVYSSRRTSLYPQGDFRNHRESILDVKTDVMCSWLYQQQLERQYATGMLAGEGVVLKKGKNNYSCCPPQLQEMPFSLYQAAMELNVRVGAGTPPCADN